MSTMSLPCSPTISMGTLTLNEELDAESDVYLALGLKEKEKNSEEQPRVFKILSSRLERIVKENEMSAQSKEFEEVMIDFHSKRAPDISIEDYIARIFRYLKCSPSCFVAAYIYMGKFLQRKNCDLTSLGVHRLLMTCVVVAAKFLDHIVYTNGYFAKAGGISTGELNKLEMKLLFDLDFRLYITAETFKKYCLMLESEATES